MTHRTAPARHLLTATLLGGLLLSLPAAAGPDLEQVADLGTARITFEPFFEITNGTAAVPVRARRISGELDQAANVCFDWSCDLSVELPLHQARETVVWLPPWSSAVNVRTGSSRWGPAIDQSWASVSGRATVALVGEKPGAVSVEELTDDPDGAFGLEAVEAGALLQYPAAVHAFRAVVLAPGLVPSAALTQALTHFVEGGGVVVSDPGAISAPEGRPMSHGMMKVLSWSSYDRFGVFPAALPFTESHVGAGSVLERTGDATPRQVSLALLNTTPDLAANPRPVVDGWVRMAAAAGVVPLAPAGSMVLFTLLFGALGIVAFVRNRTRPRELLRSAATLAIAGVLVASAGAWWFGRPTDPLQVSLYRSVSPDLVEVIHAVALRPGRGGDDVRLQAPDKRALRAEVHVGSMADDAHVVHGGDSVIVRGNSEHVVAASWSEVFEGRAPVVEHRLGDRKVQVQVPTDLDFVPLAVGVNFGGLEYFGKVDRDGSAMAIAYERQHLPSSNFDAVDRAVRSMASRVDEGFIYIYGTRGHDVVVWEVSR